jgi:hypothetical protein
MFRLRYKNFYFDLATDDEDDDIGDYSRATHIPISRLARAPTRPIDRAPVIKPNKKKKKRFVIDSSSDSGSAMDSEDDSEPTVMIDDSNVSNLVMSFWKQLQQLQAAGDRNGAISFIKNFADPETAEGHQFMADMFDNDKCSSLSLQDKLAHNTGNKNKYLFCH